MYQYETFVSELLTMTTFDHPLTMPMVPEAGGGEWSKNCGFYLVKFNRNMRLGLQGAETLPGLSKRDLAVKISA